MVLMPWYCSVQAQDATEVPGGIHVRRVGNTEVGKAFGEKYVTGRREQCEGAVAQASGMARSFNFSGNLSDTGRIETDEYFAPAQKMRARQVITYPLIETSICRLEVVKTTTWNIRHFTHTGYTDYQQLADRKTGVHWQRSAHTLPVAKQTAALWNSALFPGATVSPLMGTRTIAGRRCEVREVILAQGASHALCLLRTEAPAGGQITLAHKWVSGGILMLDEQATLVDLQAALPLALFYPPAGARIEDLSGAAGRPEDSTQKWCRVQQAKTGVNPCAAEALAHEN